MRVGRRTTLLRPRPRAALAAALVGTLAASLLGAGPPTAAAAPAITARPVISGLVAPTWIGSPPGDSRLFVTEQRGLLHVWNGTRRRVVLDVRRLVGTDGSEQGLLSAAFHANFRRNGRFWIYLTDRSGNGRVLEHRLRDGRVVAGSRRHILSVDLGRGQTNHNGGQLVYDRGKLWIAIGDGGDGGAASQNRTVLRGKLLRLAMNRGYPYRIPADNPYAAGSRFRREIYAIGLRNPWRFTVDGRTGDVYVADVGQSRQEEIDRLPAGRPRGANFGWPRFEGTRQHSSTPLAPGTTHRRPLATYPHADNACSITGGVFVRRPHAGLHHFLYADLCGEWIGGVRPRGGDRFRDRVGVPGIVGFAHGPGGHVYVASITQGRVHRLTFR